MATGEVPESFHVLIRSFEGLTRFEWSKEERTLRVIRDGVVRFWRKYKEDEKTPSAFYLDKSFRIDLKTHEVLKIDDFKEWARWNHLHRHRPHK